MWLRQGPIIAIISPMPLLILLIFFIALLTILPRHPFQPECRAQISWFFVSNKNIGAQSAVNIARHIFLFSVMLPSAKISVSKFLLSINSTFVLWVWF